MRTITLADACRILTDCSAVIVTDVTSLMYPSVADLTGEGENEFLYLSWSDDEGLDYAIKFQESNNREVKVKGSSMFLTDDEGEETELTILEPANLEVEP